MNPQFQTEEPNAEQSALTVSHGEQLIGEVIANSERQMALEAKKFEHKQRLAILFSASGCFADIKKDLPEKQAMAQAFVKIELGESMGFSAAESMQGVNLIQGTPSVSAQLRAARMQRAGYSWQIDWFENKDGVCEGCRLWLFRDGKPLMTPVRDEHGNAVPGPDGRPAQKQVSVSFLKKDAERLKTKIWEDNKPRTASVLEKDNWKNTPANMYFARAITNAQRWHAPGVLSGDVPSTEEVIDLPVEPRESNGSFEAQQAVLKEKLAEVAAAKQLQSPAETSEAPQTAPDTPQEPTAAAETDKTPDWVLPKSKKPPLQFGEKPTK